MNCNVLMKQYREICATCVEILLVEWCLEYKLEIERESMLDITAKCCKGQNSYTSEHKRELTVNFLKQAKLPNLVLTKTHEDPIFMCMCHILAIKDIISVHYKPHDKPKFSSDGQQTDHCDGGYRGQCEGVNTCSTGVRERDNPQRMEGHIRS